MSIFKTSNLTKCLLIAACLTITACGSNKRPVPLNIHSDPLGAYTMIQVKYKGLSQSDWIYLGTTPVDMNRGMYLDDAVEISLKVIQPGFHDSVKTWSAEDFRKEFKENKKILWVPNMVAE